VIRLPGRTFRSQRRAERLSLEAEFSESLGLRPRKAMLKRNRNSKHRWEGCFE